MANFNTALQWTNKTPNIYLTANYSRRRSGADMIYNVSLSISTCYGGNYFGYPIYAQIFVNGEATARFSPTLKNASPSSWTSPISYSTGEFTVSNKTSGTTGLTIRLYSSSAGGRDITWTFDMAVDPAYFTTKPTISISDITETSVKVNWSTSENCNRIRYKLDSGSFVEVFTGNATSGSFSLTGLSPASSHNVLIEGRRADSGLTTESDSKPFQLYDYPYCSNSPNFTIGNALTLTFYNPLKRNITVSILSNSNVVLATATTNGTSITGFNNSGQIANYYASIPNNSSGIYKVRVVYGSSTKTRANNNTYTIKYTEKPIVNNLTASYHSNYTALTNNDQAVINGKSTITFRITNGATAQNSSSIAKYLVSWGNSTPVEITNISNSVNLNVGEGSIINITAYDTRGLNTSKTISISELINYVDPTIQASTRRNNGIEKNTYITIKGKIFYDKFGTNGVSNRVQKVEYWVSTSQSWSGNPYTLYISSIVYKNASGNLQEYELVDVPIHANGSSGGFNIGTRYYLKVRVTDANGQISYTETTVNVTDGKIGEDMYQDDNGNYHQGINGLADSNYASYIHGAEKVEGNLTSTGDISATGTVSGATVQGTNVKATGAIYLNGTKIIWYE